MGSAQEWLQLPVSSLVSAPWNYKKKSGEEVEEAKLKVRAALHKRGQIVNLIVREMPDSLFEVVNGNHRLEVFLEDGVEKAMCFNLGEVTQDQAEMIALETNELNVPADKYQLGKLLERVTSVVPIVQAAETLPYTVAEIRDLTLEAQLKDEQIARGDDKDDAVPEMGEARVKMGDVWHLGKHKLLCGDATLLLHMEQLVGNQLIDLVFTDPPYNVDYVGKTGDALKIQNDKMSDGEFRKFLTAAFSNMFQATKPGGSFYVAHADSEGYNFRGAMVDAGWTVKQCIIWAKSSMVMGRQDYHWQHEPILYGWRGGAAHYFIDDRTQTTLWQIDRPNRNDAHPTMKPLALLEKAITNSSQIGHSVLDPFCGSGTTLIACEKTQRRCFAMELDPKYCGVILTRWAEYTGEDPVRTDGVSWHDLITNP